MKNELDSHFPAGLTGPIATLGIIRARGADAAKFIHGQLTQDFSLLAPLKAARLAALCSPKGRVLASFIGVKLAADDIVLICSRDVLEATLKRLRMFVLRAQCVLSDASAEFQLRGLIGADALRALGVSADFAPWAVQALPSAQPMEKSPNDLSGVWGAGLLIGLYPADSQPRALVLQAAASAEATLPHLPVADERVWSLAEAASGVATVSAAVVDAFVPQMLNYESVGGVNFKKGCYPGQEVVARSQFRGTLKRRAFVATCTADVPPAAGCELFVAAELAEPGSDAQPVGVVVQSAPGAGAYAARLIVSMTTAAAHQPIVARAADGVLTALQILPLPYPLLEDI